MNRQERDHAKFELEYAKLQHECRMFGGRTPPSREHILDVARRQRISPLSALLTIRTRRKW